MYSEHFTQFEVETELFRSLRYGGQEAIAEKVRKSAGMISQYMNPNDERESPFYKSAAMFAAWIEDDADAGLEALTTFNILVKRALRGNEQLDVATERRASHTERTDFVLAESEGKPLNICIHELHESMAADERLMSAMQGKRTATNKILPLDVQRAAAGRNGSQFGKR